jgi:hypothetical protein
LEFLLDAGGKSRHTLSRSDLVLADIAAVEVTINERLLTDLYRTKRIMPRLYRQKALADNPLLSQKLGLTGNNEYRAHSHGGQALLQGANKSVEFNFFAFGVIVRCRPNGSVERLFVRACAIYQFKKIWNQFSYPSECCICT